MVHLFTCTDRFLPTCRLFIDKWLQQDSCRKLNLVEKCDSHARLITRDDSKSITSMHRLISIADGIALDVKYSTYCELDDRMRIEQQKGCYMQDYYAAIQAAKKYDRKKWYEQYYKSSGSGRGQFCPLELKDPMCVDGLDWRKYEVEKFLLPRGYCERCSQTHFSSLNIAGLKLSLNCSGVIL